MRSRMWLLLLVLTPALALAGCAQKPAEEASAPAPAPAPFRVSGVELGRAVRPDMTVDSALTAFGVRDTVYASVATEGVSAGVTLKARWMFQDGSVVNESSQTIAPSGPSVSEFHVSMEKPWPKGRYMVEIWADSAAVDTVEYEVK